MNNKRIIAVLMTVVLGFSLGGCNKKGVENVVSKGENHINAGLYLANLLEFEQTLGSITGKKQKELLQTTHQDKLGTDWITQEAIKRSKTLLVAEEKFKEENLDLTEEIKLEVKNKQELYWTYLRDHYFNNGVGEESLKRYFESNAKVDVLFERKYGKDGISPVSDEALQNYVKENNPKIQYLQIPITDEKDKAIGEETLAEMMKLIEELQGKVAAGEDFSAIAPDYVTQLKGKSKTGLSASISTTVTDGDLSKSNPTAAFPVTLVEEVIGKQVNEVGIYRGEKSIILYKKIERTPEQFQEDRDTFLSDMMFRTFEEELLAEYGEEVFVINEESVAYYSPKKIKSQ